MSSGLGPTAWARRPGLSRVHDRAQLWRPELSRVHDKAQLWRPELSRVHDRAQLWHPVMQHFLGMMHAQSTGALLANAR